MASWAGGSTSRWRKLRVYVLLRDGGTCRIRGPRCTNVAESVDHITPLSKGGAKYDAANCQAACWACQRWKSDRIDRDQSFTSITRWLEE